MSFLFLAMPRKLSVSERLWTFVGMDTIDTESALRALLEQSDIWLTAATVWEIGIRGLTGFREKIAELLNSENVVLREAAEKVIHRI